MLEDHSIERKLYIYTDIYKCYLSNTTTMGLNNILTESN